MVNAGVRVVDAQGARAFTRLVPVAPLGGSLHAGKLIVLMLVGALVIGGVHTVLTWFELSDRTRDTVVAVTFFTALFVAGSVGFVRWRRRASAMLSVQNSSVDVGGPVTRSIPFADLVLVQVLVSTEIETLVLATRDGATFVFERSAWDLKAIVDELGEHAVPRMIDDVRRRLADGDVVVFRQPRSWALKRALIGLALAPLAVSHFLHFLPGLARRVVELFRTVDVLFHRSIALTETGIRRSRWEIRDVARWDEVTTVRIGALAVIVEAGEQRFWLSRSAPNYLGFIELLRALAPPGPTRPWLT
jgi:hypothetical protein